MQTKWLIAGVGGIGLLLIALMFLLPERVVAPVKVINSFEECKNAGYPIMEIYPEQCRTPDGELFVRVIEEETGTLDPDPILVPTTKAGRVTGQVTIGPICPVEREDQPCVIAPEVYTSRKVVVYGSNQVTAIQEMSLDSEGNYTFSLPPGTYWLQIVPAGIGEGEKKQVTILAGKTTPLDFDVDTGIR